MHVLLHKLHLQPSHCQPCLPTPSFFNAVKTTMQYMRTWVAAPEDHLGQAVESACTALTVCIANESLLHLRVSPFHACSCQAVSNAASNCRQCADPLQYGICTAALVPIAHFRSERLLFVHLLAMASQIMACETMQMPVSKRHCQCTSSACWPTMGDRAGMHFKDLAANNEQSRHALQASTSCCYAHSAVVPTPICAAAAAGVTTFLWWYCRVSRQRKVCVSSSLKVGFAGGNVMP